MGRRKKEKQATLRGMTGRKTAAVGGGLCASNGAGLESNLTGRRVWIFTPAEPNLGILKNTISRGLRFLRARILTALITRCVGLSTDLPWSSGWGPCCFCA